MCSNIYYIAIKENERSERFQRANIFQWNEMDQNNKNTFILVLGKVIELSSLCSGNTVMVCLMHTIFVPE